MHTQLCLVRASQAYTQHLLLNVSLDSGVTDAGKPLSKCGKCKRYMKYIAQRPSRLYCPSCEEVYGVPQVSTA